MGVEKCEFDSNLSPEIVFQDLYTSAMGMNNWLGSRLILAKKYTPVSSIYFDVVGKTTRMLWSFNFKIYIVLAG